MKKGPPLVFGGTTVRTSASPPLPADRPLAPARNNNARYTQVPNSKNPFADEEDVEVGLYSQQPLRPVLVLQNDRPDSVRSPISSGNPFADGVAASSSTRVAKPNPPPPPPRPSSEKNNRYNTKSQPTNRDSRHVYQSVEMAPQGKSKLPSALPPSSSLQSSPATASEESKEGTVINVADAHNDSGNNHPVTRNQPRQNSSRPSTGQRPSSSGDADVGSDEDYDDEEAHNEPARKPRTPEENKIIRFLVSKRVYKYPGCGDNWCSNYVAYVMNNHPLLSMFFTHPLHPFGRHQRIIVFLNGLFFAIFISFVVFETTYLPRIATCREGCDKQPRQSGDGYICKGGYNDGVDYQTYDKVCYFYSPWMLSAICGAFIVVYQSFLEFVATCSCVQGRAYCLRRGCTCDSCRRLIALSGGGILAIFSIISTSLLIWAIIVCYVIGADFRLFADIIYSKFWSVGEWFVWSAPYFMYRYPKDRRYAINRMARKLGIRNSTPKGPESRFARAMKWTARLGSVVS